MQFLVVSGLSGAGKSSCAAILEDLGFYCVDNLPAALIGQFAQLCLATKGRYEKVALVTDIRGGVTFDALFKALDELDEMGCQYSVLFIEAAKEAIIKRYKETRHKHPLTADGSTLMEAVEREIQLTAPIRNRAGYIIDTTSLPTAKLRGQVVEMFGGSMTDRLMTVNVISFGYKYGLPMDADLVFDVRLLPNPYYIAELKAFSGLDEPVREFVFSYQQTQDFVAKAEDLLGFTLPLYQEEGKSQLTIAIGCTGGRHRSTAIAAELGAFIARQGFAVSVTHRDMGRG